MADLAKVGALFKQALTSVGLRGSHSRNREAIRREILIVVRLVHKQIVEADLLERKPFGLRRGMEHRELIVDFLDFLLKLFNREGSTVFLRIFLGLQEFRPSAFEIDLLSLLREVEHVEARTRHDHGVPVPVCRAAEELPRRIRGIRLRFAHIEHPRPWIEVGEIRCPLFGQVLRHDDKRLVGPTETPGLHAHGDTRIGFSGADDMGHKRALICLPGSRDGGTLMRPHLHIGVHTGKSEV